MSAPAFRSCGSCSACCHSVPVADLGLRAFQRCRNLRSPPDAALGCSVYPMRPNACRIWSCQWLVESEISENLRPDRCGVVIDTVPDFLTINGRDIKSVQMWALPSHEEDFRTNLDLIKVIDAIFAKGWAILWRVRGPDTVTDQLTAVLMRDPDSGQWCYSPPATGNAPGTFDDADRLNRLKHLLKAEPA